MVRKQKKTQITSKFETIEVLSGLGTLLLDNSHQEYVGLGPPLGLKLIVNAMEIFEIY